MANDVVRSYCGISVEPICENYLMPDCTNPYHIINQIYVVDFQNFPSSSNMSNTDRKNDRKRTIFTVSEVTNDLHRQGFKVLKFESEKKLLFGFAKYIAYINPSIIFCI